MTRSDGPIRESRQLVGGVSTRVLEVPGDGPVIVLLHGFTDSADSWRPLLREFAARSRHAVAVDLPGSGYAPPLGRPPLASLDAFVASFVACYADAPAILVGNSLGGRLALRAAQAGDVQISGVVGLAPAGLAYGLRIQRMERWGRTLHPLLQLLYLAPVPGAVVRRGAQRLYDARLALGRAEPELGRQYASHVHGMRDIGRLWGDFLALGADDRAVPLELEKIKSPVLLIWGKRDRLTALEGAQLVLDAVPGSDLVVLDDCGHGPHVEEPRRIARLIVDFAESIPTAANAAAVQTPRR